MPLRGNRQASFNDLQATQLYCPKCKTAMPVRKRLLLVLMDREMYDYVCAQCATPVGKKEEPLSRAASIRP